MKRTETHRHHARGLFCPLDEFISRVSCSNANSQTKSDSPIAKNLPISQVKSSKFFFTHEIFSLDARVVKRIRGCVVDFILVVVYRVNLQKHIRLPVVESLSAIRYEYGTSNFITPVQFFMLHFFAKNLSIYGSFLFCHLF